MTDRPGFAELFAALPVAVLVIDGEDRIQHGNAQAELLLNLSERVMRGQLLSAILPRPPAGDRQAGHGFAVYDTEIATPHGPKIRVDFSEAQLADYPGWRAITLHSVAGTRSVGQLGGRGASARAASGAAAMLAHEIKNPLSGIRGAAQLLDAGVTRMDGLFQQALRSGALGLDPTLSPPPEPEPVVDPTTEDTGGETLAEIVGDTAPASAGIAITLQFDTPSASAVANTEGLVRGIPGVRSASTTSLALGGVSLMRVTYDGDPDALRAALEVRGLQVTGSGQTLRIRRAPQLLPPNLPADTNPAG